MLVKGDLQRTVLTPDLGRLHQARGLPVGQRAARRACGSCPPGCRELAKLKPGEGRVRPRHVHQHRRPNQITDGFTSASRPASAQADAGGRGGAQGSRPRAATRPPAEASWPRRPRKPVSAQFQQQVLQLALRYGMTGLPRVDNPDFVSTLVFDTRARAPGVPKSRFAYLFPARTRR